ncbi:ABC transporter permease [Bifidobacterium indicum]|uniref:ABC transporter permease n=1 Tax=Bifidobacterium indicum TaxID=1691 RepID=UPI0030D93880
MRTGRKVLWHDIRVSFRKSLGRFISIVCLVALGSFALVGLSVTGPDMRQAGNTYLSGHHLADLTVISSYGLDREDRKAIDTTPGSSGIEYGYLKDVVLKGSDRSLRIYSAPKRISTYEQVDGSMPTKPDQVAVDTALAEDHPIGTSIEVDEKADQLGRTVLRHHRLWVVGTVKSTEILSKVNMGPSTAGSGSLDSYAVATPGAFDSDEYMIARLTFKDLDRIQDHYSDRYIQALQGHKDSLNRILAGRPTARLAAVKRPLQDQLTKGQAQVDQARQQLDGNRQELDQARQQLDQGARDIQTAKDQLASQTAQAQTAIDQGQAQVDQGVQELASKQSQYQSSSNQVTRGRQQVDQGQQAIDQGEARLDASQRQLEDGKSKADQAVAQAQAAQTQSGQAITQITNQIRFIDTQLAAPGLSPQQQEELNRQKTGLQTRLGELNRQAQQIDALVAQAQNGRDTFMTNQYTPGMAQITAAQKELDGRRQDLAQARSQVEDGERRLSRAKGQLDQASAQLDQGRARLDQARQTLATTRASAQGQIDQGETTLDQHRAEYQTKLDQFNRESPQAQKKIDDAQKELNRSADQLSRLEQPVYALDSRREAPGSEGYKVYASVSYIVDSLARIFPYFMYLVAALVTFTTMTRFVDEERINAGTLKALGYRDRDVMAKFLVYGGVASALGALLGIVTGHTLLPWIVYRAYDHAFDLPQIHYGFHWPITLLACVLATLSAVVPAFLSAYRELREKPSALLLPKPPSAGSKILLEHIPLIWNRLSFTHKVTARNIFRYKQRMLMTIFGVCGSVALLMTGFGVQGSISAINEHQFGQVIRYDLIAAENSQATADQRASIRKRLEKADVRRSLNVHYEEMSKTAGHNADKQSITMIAPTRPGQLGDFIHLDTRSGHRPLTLTGNGVVISERIAQLTGTRTGGTITLQDSDGRDRTMRVDGICEMYLGHFVFMGPTAYRTIFHQEFSPNAHLVTFKDSSVENTRKQAASFMRIDGIQGVVQNTTLMGQIDTVVRSLNMIMQVLIIVATLLALVILYNLTNLNVEERIRELSTIKVLGFYDREVTMYIYRETILLSAIGVLAGYGFGAWLHHYIITTVPPDNVMFDPSIKWVAFAVPLVMIVIITAGLGWMVNRKLKHVDMLEALKSVD